MSVRTVQMHSGIVMQGEFVDVICKASLLVDVQQHTPVQPRLGYCSSKPCLKPTEYAKTFTRNISCWHYKNNKLHNFHHFCVENLFCTA